MQEHDDKTRLAEDSTEAKATATKEVDITKKIKPFIRYSLPIILLIAMLLVAGIFIWHQKKGSLVINDGKLTSVLVHVSSQTDGTLTEILVNDGDKVEAGQVIAKVKVVVTPEQIASLQKAYDEAQSNYDKLSNEVKASMTRTTTSTVSSPRSTSTGNIAAAQARLDSATAQKEKMEKLYSIGAVSATQYTEAKDEYNAALAGLNSASAPVEVPQEVQQSVPTPPSKELSEALANAQIQLEQAKSALDKAQSEDNYAEITAPVGGIIYLTDFKAGDELKQGDVFINVGNTKNLWVEVPLTEKEYAEVHPGQFVHYVVDDNLDLTGTVLEVMHQGESENNSEDNGGEGKINVNDITSAKISFPDEMIEQVVPGANVKVTITLDR